MLGGHSPIPVISIHALRKESDRTPSLDSENSAFQSTLSVRRATFRHSGAPRELPISIHALRKESDNEFLADTEALIDFNPRSP